jgi:hypothetical protein
MVYFSALINQIITVCSGDKPNIVPFTLCNSKVLTDNAYSVPCDFLLNDEILVFGKWYMLLILSTWIPYCRSYFFLNLEIVEYSNS